MKEDDFKPQLATLTDKAPEGEGWIHEAKLDGYRTLAFKTGKRVRLITRNGNDWTKAYEELAASMEKFPFKSIVLDGEIVALNAEGIPDFNKLQNSLGRFKPKLHVRGLVFYAFDLLYLDGKDLRTRPLMERKKLLEKIFPQMRAKNFRYSEHFETDDPNSLFRKMCQLGLEGIISKKADSLYSGSRNKDWLKTKCGQSDEFLIIGYRTGTEHEIGSLLLGSWDKGKVRFEGKVGTGFSRKTKAELAKAFRKLVSRKPTVSDDLDYTNIVWLRPELIAEVSYLGKTAEGLRHASFLRFRLDKRPQEVIHSEFDRDVLRDYYRQVSPLMLPHIRNRPLNLYICHGGPEGSCYYLRRSEIENVKTLKTVKKPNGNFLMALAGASQINDCINLGAIEFHHWGTKLSHLEHPDRMIFDLDAGEGVSVQEIQACALELKELLLEVGLKSFLMTSGGKGYHIHVPVAPEYEWEEIKAFAQTIARKLSEDHPASYTASMSPAKRKGKIFIDYLRNTRGHTAIAPYSVRAREKATIAVPIDWKDLRKTDPDSYSIKDVKKILRRKDPWEKIRSLKQRLTLLD